MGIIRLSHCAVAQSEIRQKLHSARHALISGVAPPTEQQRARVAGTDQFVCRGIDEVRVLRSDFSAAQLASLDVGGPARELPQHAEGRLECRSLSNRHTGSPCPL